MQIRNNNEMTSLEILEQINIFRKEEGDRAELQHKDLLEIIRDEFEEEISQRKISPSEYTVRGKQYPMFILSLPQSKQVLMRESKFVRKAMIHYIEELENKILEIQQKVEEMPMTIEDIMIRSLQQHKELKSRVDLVENKIDNEIRLDSGEQLKLNKAIKIRVYQRLDVISADSRLMFSAIHRDVRDRFGVPSYKDVKRKDLKLALEYVQAWIEKADMRKD